MAQTKTFYLERGSVNPPELHPANEDELIKVYETNDDAMTDLANMSDNEVFATRDNDYLGAVIVDRVEDGNYNPLTSNAVFDYIQDQLELSDWETITPTGSGPYTYAALYDGIIALDNNQWKATDNLGYVLVNGVGCASFGLMNSGTVIKQHFASMSVTVKKGDVVTSTVSPAEWHWKARYYKLRDYSRRS